MMGCQQGTIGKVENNNKISHPQPAAVQSIPKYCDPFSVPGIIGDTATKHFYFFLKEHVGSVVELELNFYTWYAVGDVSVYCEIQYPSGFLEEVGPVAPQTLFYDLPLLISDATESSSRSLSSKDEKRNVLEFQREFCNEEHFVHIELPAKSIFFVESEMASTTHVLRGRFFVSARDKWHRQLTLTPID